MDPYDSISTLGCVPVLEGLSDTDPSILLNSIPASQPSAAVPSFATTQPQGSLEQRVLMLEQAIRPLMTKVDAINKQQNALGSNIHLLRRSVDSNLAMLNNLLGASGTSNSALLDSLRVQTEATAAAIDAIESKGERTVKLIQAQSGLVLRLLSELGVIKIEPASPTHDSD